MEDRRKTKSFWSTMPGIITACASLIIAISGILGTLKATNSWPFLKPPIVNYFNASQSTVETGQSCKLSWDVAGATEIDINPGYENLPLTGEREVFPTETTTYKLSAKNKAGEITRTIRVTVEQKPPVVNYFNASQSTVEAGQSCKLSWDVAGATEIDINPGYENLPLTGEREVFPTETTTYKLSAKNKAGEITRTIRVTVEQIVTPKYTLNIIVSPSESGRVIPNGGDYDEGTQITITATAESFWEFDKWTGDVWLNSPTITVTMDSDMYITAQFKKYYSDETQVIIAHSNIKSIYELQNRIIAAAPGASWKYAEVALDTYEIQYSRPLLGGADVYEEFTKGYIDAVIVCEHTFVSENVNVLRWSETAIEAVINTFPETVATYLKAGTYEGQNVDIKGYAKPE